MSRTAKNTQLMPHPARKISHQKLIKKS